MVGNGIIKPDPEKLRPLEQLPPPTNPKSLKRVLGLFAYYAKWIKQFFEKIKCLKEAKSFPLNDSQISDFQNLKKEIARALRSIDESTPFVVECDASDNDFFWVSILSQNILDFVDFTLELFRRAISRAL